MFLNHLDVIATKHGTDKSMAGTRKLSAKAYTVAYNNYLEPVRDEPIVMLEIGVWQGSSLRMWEEFLPNARLFAIDIDPSCKRHETARSKVFIGDKTNYEFLKQVAEAAGEPFHCIIDDGGHQMEHHPGKPPGAFALSQRSRLVRHRRPAHMLPYRFWRGV